MDLAKLFQCSVMEEFNDIMSDSVKSMGINNTSEWWALRTRLDVRMKVSNTALCLFNDILNRNLDLANHKGEWKMA